MFFFAVLRFAVFCCPMLCLCFALQCLALLCRALLCSALPWFVHRCPSSAALFPGSVCYPKGSRGTCPSLPKHVATTGMGPQNLPYFVEENGFATRTWGHQGAKKATDGCCEVVFLGDLRLFRGHRCPDPRCENGVANFALFSRGKPLYNVHLGRPRHQKGNGRTLRSEFPRGFKVFFGGPNFQIRAVKMGSQIAPYFLEENRVATCTRGGQGAKKATGGLCEAIFLEDLKPFVGGGYSRSKL